MIYNLTEMADGNTLYSDLVRNAEVYHKYVRELRDSHAYPMKNKLLIGVAIVLVIVCIVIWVIGWINNEDANNTQVSDSYKALLDKRASAAMAKVKFPETWTTDDEKALNDMTAQIDDIEAKRVRGMYMAWGGFIGAVIIGIGGFGLAMYSDSWWENDLLEADKSRKIGELRSNPVTPASQ
jgi:hypothetical protein